MTDGKIHDMPETKELIVESCDLPMSIIIVGIFLMLGLGDDDFKDMYELDGNHVIKDKVGKEVSRGIVQFVEYNKCKNIKELEE